MNAKYVKRLCSVRGCKNTDSFMISLTREMGNSVIICRECAKAAFGAIKTAEKAKPVEKKKTGIPPLFFNSYIRVAADEPKNDGVNGTPSDTNNDDSTNNANESHGAEGADGTNATDGTSEQGGANATTE